MGSKTDLQFVNTYQPLLKSFISKIDHINKENLPEPFLPVYGKLYDQTPFKIAFVGWETRDNSSLADFCSEFDSSPIDCLYRFREDLFPENDDGFKFNYYGNNFGKTFWDFILKFLAQFHNISDWKSLKNGEVPHIAEILQSFIWANTNAIERYSVTAKKLGANEKEWQVVSLASKAFDSSHILIEALSPKVIIILHWEADESWLTDHNGYIEGPIEITETLLYYHLIDSSTHVYWTKHPVRMSIEKIDFDETINQILKHIISKKIFESIPVEKRYEMVSESKKQLSEIAFELEMNLLYFPNEDQFGRADSGVVFLKDNWKHAMGFGFDKSNEQDFFWGVRSFDFNQKDVREKIIEKLGCELNDQPTKNWPSWYWHQQYRNWDNSIYEELKNGNFKINIKDILTHILNQLHINDIEL